MSEFRVTTSDDTIFRLATNRSNIVISASPEIKYTIGWNISDVEDECARKSWTIESTDGLRRRT
jgi:hypothetical protein